MGAFSIWHWIIVLVVVLVLFGGKGKISALMGDFGKGLKSFKKGMKDDDAALDDTADTTDHRSRDLSSIRCAINGIFSSSMESSSLATGVNPPRISWLPHHLRALPPAVQVRLWAGRAWMVPVAR